MIDVAMCLDELVPAAQYKGSLTEDHVTRDHGGDEQAAYQALRWEDVRSQPAWSEIETVWPEVEAAIIAEAARLPEPTVGELFAAIDAKDKGDTGPWEDLRSKLDLA